MMVKPSTIFVLGALLFSAVAAIPFGARDTSEIQSDDLEEQDTGKGQVLAAHNKARAQYGANPLQWSSSLYPATLAHAEACKFTHSDSQGKYGENLFASSNPETTIADAMDSWMKESAQYDYNQPEYSDATGHFTQVVWKSTTEVSCAMSSCPGGSILPQPTKFIVCHYSPPGNYQGQFSQNVGRPLS